jgi:hypothetical protein
MPIGAEDMAHLSGDSIAASTQDRLIDAGPPELDAGPPEPDAASPTAGLSEALSEDESSADDQEGVPTSFLGHKVSSGNMFNLNENGLSDRIRALI